MSSIASTMPDQRTLAAFHEAGHVVARAWRGLPPAPVEIDDDGGGMAHGFGERVRFDAYGLVVVALAGPMSEHRYAGRPFDPETYVEWDGWADDDGDDGDGALIGRMVREHGASVEHAQREVEMIFAEHWDAVSDVAHALVERGHLSADEVDGILERHGLGGGAA